MDGFSRAMGRAKSRATSYHIFSEPIKIIGLGIADNRAIIHRQLHRSSPD
jgi:hypothetical protein